MIKIALAKILTTKIAAVAAAATVVTAGGVAAVAATGNLPTPGGGHSSVSGNSSAAPTTSAAAASTTSDENAAGHPTGSANADDHSASPTPSLTGLCQAYTAGAGSEHGKALESPAFTFLITTAGGKDKVDGYCAALLAERHEPPGQTRAATPSMPSEANNHSTGARKTDVPGTQHAAEPPVTHPSH
ncbi:hypothetical protein [Amycolatopsis sp. GM8]|uniref:hypothetical protein n=1 Tax=Amycolatopsis sp. GM8 TaxID=2896530 RepID=UPI001F158773|nr:hypothetical protein [Amycolatopsis sp. GM8]